MKAVIYDKWLHSLGGGEVVACNIAKILKDQHYQVLFISGKEVSKETIYEKLKIDLRGIEFKQVWNDETALKKLVKDKDLFINISFLDYSIGFAKKNIYYVNFPTKLHNNFKGMIVNTILVPILTRLIKPVEFLSQIEAPLIIASKPAFLLKEENKFALSNLTPNQIQEASFTIHLTNFYKSFLEDIKVSFDNAQLIDRNIWVNHGTNTLEFTIRFVPKTLTAYLNLTFQNFQDRHNFEEEKVYLFYPKIYLSGLPNFLFSNLRQRFVTRLRAGIFVNLSERINTYQIVITYSRFAWKWIRKYWNKDAKIIAPPVDLLYKRYKVSKYKKNNWICSVGRFFTLGHGKKQEILIEAFKKLYDKSNLVPSRNKNLKKWELHLVGGLGDEPTSINFFRYLKETSKGYPIFFHLNASRAEVEEVYLRSKIYWHATGFGEDENLHPIRFEHFGIAPIEALSAKCIPILFNGGGLPEFINKVGLDRERNLFRNIEELVNNTIYYKDFSNQKLDWNNIFRKIDERYSFEAFKKNFLKVINS